MNFFSTPLKSLRNDGSHCINGSPSPNEIIQEEINDTSSPECADKSGALCFIKSSSFKKNKQSVKRNIFNHKPILDIQLSKKNEGSSKRKGYIKVGMKQNKISRKDMMLFHNSNDLFSVTKLGKNGSNRTRELFHIAGEESIEIDDQDSIINVDNLFTSTVSKNDDKILSPEIITDDEDCQNQVDNCNHEEKIISSQEANVNKSFDDNKFLSSFEESKESSLLACEEDCKSQAVDCSQKEEIISSQKPCVNKSFDDYQFLNSFEESKESSHKILACEEDYQTQLNKSSDKEEITSSQEVDVNKSFNDNKFLSSFEESNPKTLAGEEDGTVISHCNSSLDDIVYSQDSVANVSNTDEKNNSSTDKNEKEFLYTAESFNVMGNIKENLKFQSSEIVYCSQDSHHSLLYEDVINEPLELSTESLNIEQFNEKLENKISSFEENKDQDVCSSSIENNPLGIVEIVDSRRDFVIKTKRKGSLLHRAYCIISALRKEENLFTHEIKVGLRTAKGLHVSEPIIVKNIYYEEGKHILSCLPSVTSGGTTALQKKELIHLIISKLPSDVGIDSAIVIHFPLVAILMLPSMRVLLFAENRVQVLSVNKINWQGSLLNNMWSFNFICPKEEKLIHTIKQRDSKNIFGSVVDQLFGNFYSIELRVLHCFRKTVLNYTGFEILAVDADNQFCLIKDSECIFLKDLNFKEGSLCIFHGFKVKECLRVQNYVKTEAQYYSSVEFCCDFIFILEPYIESWVITFIKEVTIDHTEFTS